MKLIMLTEEALVNMPKNEVDVNIDDSLDWYVDISVSSEVGRCNDVREWGWWWSWKWWWWIIRIRSCEWS